MPIITVQLIEGRDPAALERLGKNLTDAMAAWEGVSRESITVVVHEVPRRLWLSGGSPVAPGKKPGASGTG